MKIFPARIGPTVCEELGPTGGEHNSAANPVRRMSQRRQSERTSDAEEVKGGDDRVLVLLLMGADRDEVFGGDRVSVRALVFVLVFVWAATYGVCVVVTPDCG